MGGGQGSGVGRGIGVGHGSGVGRGNGGEQGSRGARSIGGGRGSGGYKGSEERGERANGNGKRQIHGAEEGGVEGDSEEESYIQGAYEEGESSTQITYQRATQSNSVGIYKKKPKLEEIVHFFEGKGIREPEIKKTLSHIARVHWDENTRDIKGAECEAFYIKCVKFFKEYYKYPDGYGTEAGDYGVREHLRRNFKHLLNP